MRKLLGAGGTLASTQSKAPSNVPSTMNSLGEMLEVPTSRANRNTNVPFSHVGKTSPAGKSNAYSKKTGFKTVSGKSSKGTAC